MLYVKVKVFCRCNNSPNSIDFWTDIFLLRLEEQHWLIRLYRFQVYITMIHDLYIALCAYHPKSNHLLSPYIWPPLPCTTPYHLPSGSHHTVVCVSEFQFYIPHMSEIICFVAFSDWLISFSIIFSRSVHVVTNGNISSFHLVAE